MATPIPAELRQSLAREHPEAWVDHLLGAFPPEYLTRFDAATISRHLTLIRELEVDRPVRVRAERLPDDPETWRVEIAGHDAFQLFSTVCMLLTISRLSIVGASIFTSDPPAGESPSARTARPSPAGTGRFGAGHGLGRPGASRASRSRPEPDRRRKILDVFHVRPAVGGEAPDWPAFEEELSELAQWLRQGQHDEVHSRLIPRFAAALGDRRPIGGPLDSILLEITSEGPDRPTRVDVRARDSFGFLSLTASALALSGFRIVRADVCTVAEHGWAEDTLWITDRSGRPILDPDRLLALKYTLILIEHFSTRLPKATDPQAALVHFSRFANDLMARPDRAREFAALDRPEVLDALVRVLGESRFLWEDFLQSQPENILPLIADPARWRYSPSRKELAEDLARRLARDADADLDARIRALRRFKDREIFRADVRTILRLSGGPEGFADELTDVAEVVIAAALDLAIERLGPDRPLRGDGRPVPVALCALGKFGGRELGFASDLELMVVWDDRDQASPAGSPPASEYFDRLVATLRQVLGVRSGATFELDFRLRPYGKGGPPATALSLFESYYRAGGAAWAYERQALIRLHTVAGDAELGRYLERRRDAFVYGPEPLDHDALRKMRAMQLRQLIRPGTINAKLSPGALVDIEYAVQALQITFGRDNTTLRCPSTLAAIEALLLAGHLDAETALTLSEGCRFFRSLIGALRVVRGHADDLTVPPSDSEDFALLARRLRLDSPSALTSLLQEQLSTVKDAVDRILSPLG